MSERFVIEISFSMRDLEKSTTEDLADLIDSRWARMEGDLDKFTEDQERDGENPVAFIETSIEKWANRREEARYIDPESACDRALFLLALLVEQGAEWPSDKRISVRRFLKNFLLDRSISGNVSAKYPKIWDVLNNTILSSNNKEVDLGKITEEELSLIEKWKTQTGIYTEEV